MFEEYLEDSYYFYELALNSAINNEREARRYYRASTFYASGAMEAFVNYVAEGLSQGKPFEIHEIAFLQDKTFTPQRGKLVQQTRYYSIDDKLKFIVVKYDPDYDFGTNKSWNNFIEFKRFRDLLVHPRQGGDEKEVAEYKKQVQSGLSSIIAIMNSVSINVYGQPLRKQLLDLIPE